MSIEIPSLFSLAFSGACKDLEDDCDYFKEEVRNLSLYKTNTLLPEKTKWLF